MTRDQLAIVRTVQVPDDWQSRDGCEWFPYFDERPIRLHLHIDGSVSWSRIENAVTCEFCGKAAPEDQFHPYWHDEGSPMVACDRCIEDVEPAPSDGPDYHADHEAWSGRNIGRDEAGS